MLDLLRENEAALRAAPHSYQELLRESTVHLKILHSGSGEEDLITAVAAERAKLRAFSDAANSSV